MAARENQGLQIALIIFVMLTIILSVTTYIFSDNAKKEAEKFKVKQAEAEAEKKKFESINTKKDDLLAVVGIKKEDFPKWETDEKTKDDKTDHEQIMIALRKVMTDNASLVGADKAIKDDPELFAKANFQALLKIMSKAVADKNVEVAKFEAKSKAAEKSLADAAAKYAADVAKLTAGLATVTTGYKGVHDTYTAKITEHEGEQKKSEQSVAQLNADKEAKEEDLVRLRKEKRDKELGLQEIIGSQKKTLSSLTDPRPSLTDGIIIDVNERTSTAIVNIGKADGIARRVTFNVYAKGTNDVATAVKKGSLEITDVLDDKTAQARIKENAISDPILPGDFIDSPLWYPGRKQKFAIAGNIDFDNDGSSDRQILKDLIVANGGEIVAELNDKGELIGKVTPDTVGLILGKQPGDGAGDQTDKIKKWTDISNQAQSLSVPKIDLHKFLESIGYTKPPKYEETPRGTKYIETNSDKQKDQIFRPRGAPPKTSNN